MTKAVQTNAPEITCADVDWRNMPGCSTMADRFADTDDGIINGFCVVVDTNVALNDDKVLFNNPFDDSLISFQSHNIGYN